jgi:Leucine-rich repeat (LRR) protein
LSLNSNNLFQDLSFLTSATNLEELRLVGNKFTGSLDYLSNMKKLKYLDISDTDINEINIDKLSKDLEQINYFVGKTDSKLTDITQQLNDLT